MLRIILLTCISLFLIGCAQSVTSIKQDKTKTLDAKKGYLLIGVETTLDLHNILLTGEKRIQFTKQDLKAGSNYILVDIPAGKYQISDVKFGRYMKLELVNGYWDFEVKANKINYIGNLKIKGDHWFGWVSQASVILNNRSTTALTFLGHKFPMLLKAHPLQYGGPGEDHFFDYVYSLNKQKESL